MRVILRYSDHARKDLHKLDRDVARKIVYKIAENAALRDPLVRAKALSGVLTGFYRYRIGEYRVIFEVDTEGVLSILTILRIKHRKEVYRAE